MRGGAAPPALLFAALGFALAFAPDRARASSLLALFATLGIFSALPAPWRWQGGIFFGCWISVIATAGSVYFVRELSLSAALTLSLNAGIWAGAVISVSGARIDLLKALPCLLVVWPASWVGRHDSVPIKVLSSWVIAVAVLAVTLQLLPVTPGYLPDHME